MKKPYHIVSSEAKIASAAVEEFARANGQILLPLVELITQARMAVDEVIDSIGRQTIETILNLSIEQVPGRARRARAAERFAGTDRKKDA